MYLVGWQEAKKVNTTKPVTVSYALTLHALGADLVQCLDCDWSNASKRVVAVQRST
jgi:hypothetical protein